MHYAGISKLVLYDSVLFQRTGSPSSIWTWAERLEARFTMYAREEAPLNKREAKSTWRGLGAYPVGSLKFSLRGDVDEIGPKQLRTTISANVPYALYVLRGTGPFIWPDSGDYMTLPPNLGYHNRRAAVVSGQSANNFLARAARRTAARHPSIRGFDHVIG